MVVGAPTSAAQIRGLRARATELRRQLESAREDRLAIAQRLRQGTAGGADQAGLEARIRVIDERILRIERDISTTEAQIGAAPPELFAAAQEAPRRPGGLSADAKGALGGLFMLVVMMPLAVAWARLIWRRSSRTPSVTSSESDARLARLETAVDTIAIEMERVSEGQRFVTRLLSDARTAADPLAIPTRETAELSTLAGERR